MEPPPIRAELRIQTICIATLTVLAVAVALYWLRPVMIPFIVASFLAFALRPLVDSMEMYARLPRTLAVCAALLLALFSLLSVGWLVKISVAEVTSNLNQYEDQVQEIWDHASQWLWAAKFWGRSQPGASSGSSKEGEESTQSGGPPAERSKSEPQKAPLGEPRDEARIDDGTTVATASPSTNTKTSDEAGTKTSIPPVNPFEMIPDGLLQSWFWSITGVVADIVKQSGVVLVFLFFLLLSSVKRDRPIGGAWGEVESQIRAYLIAMTALSAACGISVWLVLALFAVQAAILFGLLTFLLNFIPNIGSAIATVLPLPFIWMSPELSLPSKLAASLIPAAIQFAIGNFIQPKVMGNSMRLHPVVILMALIFWGMLWGFVGMFFAVPITSMIRIACDRHELTKPVANLMAGNLDALREAPPPTPVVAEVAPR